MVRKAGLQGYIVRDQFDTVHKVEDKRRTPCRKPEKTAGSRRQDPGSVRGYRSGYLPAERRETEKDLRSGKLRAVVSTNAGTGYRHRFLDLVLIHGFPGSIASWQQIGRAGAEQPLSRSHNTVSPSCGQVSRREAGMASRGISRAGIDPKIPTSGWNISNVRYDCLSGG